MTDIVGAEGTATGTGAQNTVDILAGCPERPMAASVAADYPGPNGDSLGEWFLPSKDELNELYLNRVVAGDFPNGLYWSSSEVGDCAAWYQFFFNGFQGNGPKFDTFGVRAIRIF